MIVQIHSLLGQGVGSDLGLVSFQSYQTNSLFSDCSTGLHLAVYVLDYWLKGTGWYLLLIECLSYKALCGVFSVAPEGQIRIKSIFDSTLKCPS